MKKSGHKKSTSGRNQSNKKVTKSLKNKEPKISKIENDYINSIVEMYVEEPIDVYACQYSDPTSSYTSPSPYTC